MKKKILIFTAIAIVFVLVVYRYAYQPQRNIASEKSTFELSVMELQTAFSENDSLANKIFLDKTITIYGKITNIDLKNSAIVLDSKIYVTFLSKNQYNLSVNQEVIVKGRFIGYDDLIEEFRFDQATIVD